MRHPVRGLRHGLEQRVAGFFVGVVFYACAGQAYVFVTVRQQDAYFVVLREGFLKTRENAQQGALQQIVAFAFVLREYILLHHRVPGEQLDVGQRGPDLVADVRLHVLEARMHALQQLVFRYRPELVTGYPSQHDKRCHHQRQHQEQQFEAQFHDARL